MIVAKQLTISFQPIMTDTLGNFHDIMSEEISESLPENEDPQQLNTGEFVRSESHGKGMNVVFSSRYKIC